MEKEIRFHVPPQTRRTPRCTRG